MVDTHCHLQDLTPEIEVEKFRAAGGTVLICCGAGIESSKKAIEIAEKYPEVWATVGIHPEEKMQEFKNPRTQNNLKEKLKMLLNHKKAVAVGECGLDYGEQIEDEERQRQIELFRFNIELATESELPLVVHCRNAFEEVFQELRAKDKVLRGGVQMHCWTGSWEWAEKFLGLGCYLSFGGIATFKNSQEIREVIKKIPDDRLLLETDSPYLAPEPVRGSTNSPTNVRIVARLAAELRGRSPAEIDDITTANAKKLFGKI